MPIAPCMLSTTHGEAPSPGGSDVDAEEDDPDAAGRPATCGGRGGGTPIPGGSELLVDLAALSFAAEATPAGGSDVDAGEDDNDAAVVGDTSENALVCPNKAAALRPNSPSDGSPPCSG